MDSNSSHAEWAQELLDLLRGGGKATGWGLVGSATALLLAVVLRAPQTAAFGTIGSMFGLGAYGIRLFQRFQTPRYEQLDDDLRDLGAMRLSLRITDQEFARMRAKILAKFGF